MDLDYEYYCNEDYPFPLSFMNALPYLRYFTNVTALHIRFEEHCGNHDLGYDIDETYELRYKVLDTVFHCATGIWTLEKQLKIDEVLGRTFYGRYDEDYKKCDYDGQDIDFTGACFPLRELTVANLADYSDRHLEGSKAWKILMALPSLVDLKLFITTEEDDAAPENSIYYTEKYDFFDSLPSTWLCVDMTQRLRVLSLYFKDYWGWFPVMDFRNCGEESPFPQLKVLALGNYVFTHEWQIEWFSKLGSENSSGGLEELYLDDCPILHHARQNDVCEGGYPDRAVVSNQQDYNPSEHYFSIRWHSLLSHWKGSMKGLKVFRMGHGSWGHQSETYTTITDDPDYADLDTDVLKYRLSHNVHKSFAFPATDAYVHVTDGYLREPEKWRQGEGLDDRRETRLTYIDYDIGTGPSPWLETRDTTRQEDVEPEEGTAKKDDVAWDAIMATIKGRR